MNITYQLDFSRFREHLVDVRVELTVDCDNPVVWLPAWIAGSYLIREFARHITAIEACINDGTPIRLKKHDKNHWLVPANRGDKLILNYEVYAYDLSVRGAYVDETRLYGNFSALLVSLEQHEQRPIQVELVCPQDFVAINAGEVGLACALPLTEVACRDEQVSYHLTADNYEQLIDSPFEIAEQDAIDFVVQTANRDIEHQLVLSGVYQCDLERLARDVQSICQGYVNWLGDAPFEDYLFLTMATDNDYGGLEHLTSTSLITPRDDLPSYEEADEPSEGYQRFLGLCSHEYFHAWWVKSVRPANMLTPDLSHEAYTSLLWVFEGFTSYVDDFMLQACGVISQASYLKLLTEQINRYLHTSGRRHQSVAESSFDAWIKLYRSDENTGNAGISYYNKGALVALCLDITLMQHGSRLFSVIKQVYQQAKTTPNQRFGMDEANLDKLMQNHLPAQTWQAFKRDYIEGVADLPLAKLLAEQGVSLEQKHDEPNWGMKTSPDAAGLKVQRVLRGSQAAAAGLSAHDVIIAIDGLKASEKRLKAALKYQASRDEPSLCHVFRRDELLVLEVPPPSSHFAKFAAKVQLSLADETNAAAWLEGISP